MGTGFAIHVHRRGEAEAADNQCGSSWGSGCGRGDPAPDRPEHCHRGRLHTRTLALSLPSGWRRARRPWSVTGQPCPQSSTSCEGPCA